MTEALQQAYSIDGAENDQWIGRKHMANSRLTMMVAVAAVLCGCGSELPAGPKSITQEVQSTYELDIDDEIGPFQMKNWQTQDCMKYDDDTGRVVEVTCSATPNDAEKWLATVVGADRIGEGIFAYTYTFENVKEGDCLYRNSGTNGYELASCDTSSEFRFTAYESFWWGYTQLTTDGNCLVSNYAGSPPPYYVGESFSPPNPPCQVGVGGDAKEWFTTKILASGCGWSDPSCDSRLDP